VGSDRQAHALHHVTVGIELELLCPPGVSRRDVAVALARQHDAQVQPIFHPDSEPALVPGTPIFENLTLGFEVRGSDGSLIARLVDDLTLQADLDRHAPPRPGWFRVVSDDRRLLHLVRRHGRADGDLLDALTPLAELYGTQPDVQDGIVRVADPDGAPLALGAPLPGERERPCELVTPPLPRDQVVERVATLLQPALDLGLVVPVEAATHVHVDRTPLEDARVVRRLVHLWEAEGAQHKARAGTNPACRRLGRWSAELRALVDEPGFVDLAWPAAKQRLARLGLSKFVDLNLKGLAHDLPGKPTIEARYFPGTREPQVVGRMVEQVMHVVERAVAG